mmetsp:Transcript_36367/g.58303  ORF Transcript_36367/g.58303 Transcript_36367/m.58303 type:complete len:486 (+) Transcript_36367:4311-5768(+)
MGTIDMFFLGGVVYGGVEIRRLDAKETLTGVFLMSRGVGQYDSEFLPINVTIRPTCMWVDSVYPTEAYLGHESQITTIELFNGLNKNGDKVLRWEEPCPDLRLAKTFGDNNYAQIGANDDPKIEVTVFNPRHLHASFSEMAKNDRLQSVQLYYRPLGTYDWIAGLTPEGTPVNFANEIAETYGYSTLWWGVRALSDGTYEMQVQSTCEAIGYAKGDLDTYRSETITVKIDRVGPALLRANPENGNIKPGTEINLVFDKEISCRPTEPQLTLNISGVHVLTNRDLDVHCSGDKITISLPATFEYDSTLGKDATIQVHNAQDLFGNTASAPAVKNVHFENIDLSSISTKLQIEFPLPNCTPDRAHVRTFLQSHGLLDKYPGLIIESTTCVGDKLRSHLIVPSAVSTQGARRLLSSQYSSLQITNHIAKTFNDTAQVRIAQVSFQPGLDKVVNNVVGYTEVPMCRSSQYLAVIAGVLVLTDILLLLLL